ncbi:MAG: DUF1249 domain-containing protein [Gammaproteobacteria bacterium]
MLIETIGQHVRLVQPRSFAGLMTLYEGNHVRLRQLLGNLWHLPSKLVSTSSTDLSIHLSLDGCSRYTTSMRMTYQLEAEGSILADPDLLVRIYHDARLAEAVSCCETPRRKVFSGLWVPAADEFEKRWLLNILLNKWLEHCLDHRHIFGQSRANNSI